MHQPEACAPACRCGHAPTRHYQHTSAFGGEGIPRIAAGTSLSLHVQPMSDWDGLGTCPGAAGLWSKRQPELACERERTGELQLGKISIGNDGTEEKKERTNILIDAFFVFCDLSDTKTVFFFFQRYVSLTRGLCLLGELSANFKSEEACRSLTERTEGWLMWAGDSWF